MYERGIPMAQTAVFEKFGEQVEGKPVWKWCKRFNLT
jgi:hypothetical protein